MNLCFEEFGELIWSLNRIDDKFRGFVINYNIHD